jgi:hypothetical protein
MELDFVCFAQASAEAGGLLDVLGLGWRSFQVDSYPASFRAVLVLATEMEAWEAVLPHRLRVDYLDETGQELGRGIDLDLQFQPGATRFLQAFDLSHLQLTRDGDYWAEVWLDGTKARDLSFHVQQAARPRRGISQRASRAD